MQIYEYEFVIESVAVAGRELRRLTLTAATGHLM